MAPKNLAIIVGSFLIGLFLIKTLDLSFPLTIVNTTKTSEFAVTGEAKIDVIPDTAQINAGISVRGERTVEEARRKMDEVNNKIVAALLRFGIAKKDITTSNYSINPNIVYRDNQDVESGYNGNATILIKVKNIDLASQVIDEVSRAGATHVNGPSFTIDDPSKLREEARNKAIENAKQQAQKLASSLGIKLGKIVNVVESSPGQPPIMYRAQSMEGGAGGAADLPDLEPGSQTITSTVTLYFEKK